MRLTVIVALLTLIVDQASKLAVVHGLDLATRGRIAVFPPYLEFSMGWNRGINFGLLTSSSEAMRWGLVALALAVSLWVWLWVRREGHRPVVMWAAGLLIGGAVGNAIDRVIYGAVADFLNMSLPGIENPYSFNVADVAIFAGAIGLVVFAGREKTP
ncbi:signal peptidase II [Albidovulum sp.]